MSERTLDGLLSLSDVAGDAPLGDPDEEGLGELRELGRGLTNYLFQSLRILAIHDSQNAAVEEPLGRLTGVLGRLFAHTQTVHFITVEGQVYLNDLRIKMEASAYANVSYLLGQLGRHGIGGITFVSAIKPTDLKRLMLILLETKPPAGEDSEKLDHIRAALDEADIPDVEFDQPYYFKDGEDGGSGDAGPVEQSAQEQAALSYAKGVLAVKDYFRAVEAAEAANPLRIRKIVHDLVDVAEDDPDDFLKLHVIQGVEDPYYNHCVNVATLAVALGRVLGLTRVELADLGAAAMFHDVGYSAIERQEIEEKREFSDQDRMRLHPISGFKSLLKQGEYGPGLLRRLLVTLEHHMHFSRPGGYPNLGRKTLSVFTRIVQVADHYDALVTPSEGTPGLLPVKALERIVASAGSAFDPVVVKALVQVVGRYPYGSLVKLNTGEVGVVTCGGRTDEAFMRPIVMLVRAGDGSEIAPHAVDLAVKDLLRRRVQSVLDPHDEHLTPHAVLFDQLATPEEEPEDPSEEDADAEDGLDADAWNKAVWEGEDVETILAGTLSEDDAVPVVDDEVLPDEDTGEHEIIDEPLPPDPAWADEEEPARVDPATMSAFIPPLDDSWDLPPAAVPELAPVLTAPEERRAEAPSDADDDPGPQEPAPDGEEQDDVLAWLDAELGGEESTPAEAPAVPEEPPDEGSSPPGEEFPLPDDGFPLPDDGFPLPDDEFGPATVEIEPLLPPAEQALAPLRFEPAADPVESAPLPPLLTEDGEEPEGYDDLPPLLTEDGEEPAATAPPIVEDLSDDDRAWLDGLEAAPASRPTPPPAFGPDLDSAEEPPASAPPVPIGKAELNAMIQKAFARGGENAVQRLMDQLKAEGRA